MALTFSTSDNTDYPLIRLVAWSLTLRSNPHGTLGSWCSRGRAATNAVSLSFSSGRTGRAVDSIDACSWSRLRGLSPHLSRPGRSGRCGPSNRHPGNVPLTFPGSDYSPHGVRHCGLPDRPWLPQRSSGFARPLSLGGAAHLELEPDGQEHQSAVQVVEPVQEEARRREAEPAAVEEEGVELPIDGDH